MGAGDVVKCPLKRTAIVVMLRRLKMYGMGGAVCDLQQFGTPKTQKFNAIWKKYVHIQRLEKTQGRALNQRVLGSNPSVSTIFTIMLR
jgi:hypothetical protein